MTEILAPAGDEQSAHAAFASGADAIYLGLSEFSARESAENFGLTAFERTAVNAHLLGVKVYVCLNTLVKDGETERFFNLAREAWIAGADAILVQDIFLGKRLKEAYPEMELHLSTQAGVCNERGARLAKEYGFSRVVLARETPLEEIAEISAVIETEAFVQGALCTCFSGQCYLSSFAGNNSGNRGRCKQPCRKRYTIDRKGFETASYALSLSDLSAGERVKELIAAGVSSLKIEGRLRRPEYVSAAVSYYRSLLNGKDGAPEFSRLKRAFNRGDYTKGLAFGQDETLISRKVQGHIGEKIGEISVRGGKYFCNGAARKGDGFKILRGGYEVGGAAFAAEGKGGFYLTSKQTLRAGDEVRITTDTQTVFQDVVPPRDISLRLRFRAGQLPQAACGEFVYTGKEPLACAKNAPLTQAEIADCFFKTDGLNFNVRYQEIVTENAFMPKSALNAFRREFYGALIEYLIPQKRLEEKVFSAEIERCAEGKTAVIAEDFGGLSADILILKPRDYRKITRDDAAKGTGEKYLYLPPFFTGEDERSVRAVVGFFDGIYCDGYYGIPLAREYEKPLFAGTGFNLTNRFAASGALAAGAKYYALSKELTGAEQRMLSGKGAFALALGGIKVMDLCYCPFNRTCADCDCRTEYTLTDEEGRRFPLRRYLVANGCRFEVYNCAPLAAYNGVSGALVDLSVEHDGRLAQLARNENVRTYLKNPTKGHYDRSLL